jgi:spore germination cell wall hydrolase CwlJ-like protein
MKKILIATALFSNMAQADILYAQDSHPQEWCLAQNIYYEARSSSFADQVAVADVVLNRVQSQRYPNTICSVVQQGPVRNGLPVRDKCQFSWYCDGKSDYPTNKDAWANAQYIAYQMMHNDQYRGITEGATHYHADYVKPRWASKIQHIGQIGAHIYYREK